MFSVCFSIVHNFSAGKLSKNDLPFCRLAPAKSVAIEILPPFGWIVIGLTVKWHRAEFLSSAKVHKIIKIIKNYCMHIEAKRCTS